MTADDDTVWKVYEAQKAEVAWWRAVLIDHSGGYWAIRDRRPIPLDFSAEETVQDYPIERLSFDNKDQALEYISWRGVKAGIELLS